MTEEGLRAEILAFFAQHNVMSLATSAPDGKPHAANLMFANEGFVLYWVSAPDSRHSRHIEADPRVAASVAPDYGDYKDIRGLQIAGTARRVSEPVPAARALKLLAAKFGFFGRFLDGPKDLAGDLRKAAVYRLDCETITLIDNTVAFGHKEVLDLMPRSADNDS